MPVVTHVKTIGVWIKANLWIWYEHKNYFKLVQILDKTLLIKCQIQAINQIILSLKCLLNAYLPNYK